uniref:ribosomal protein L9 n=1 Tax=Lophurella stichidiosa TaxID=2008659 RepID=UPI002551E412|nr:ribosomal protein L9 [Aphanocladia stichidiosa]WGH14001.1 ribosomal protein L9 [Aphanocladia stichidiosa]
MKKKVDVILINNNLTAGKKGSIINVARGYAFNYLIPNKIAEIATNKKIKHMQMFENIAIQQKETSNIEIKLLKNNIQKIESISIYKKKGENNLIFGSITEKDITKWINKYTNLLISKIQIKTSEINLIGITHIKIQINTKVNVNIPVKIIPTNI